MLLRTLRSFFIREKLVEYYNNGNPVTLVSNNTQIVEAIILEIGYFTVTITYEDKYRGIEEDLFDTDVMIAKGEINTYGTFTETILIADITAVSAKIIDLNDLKGKKSELDKLYENQ